MIQRLHSDEAKRASNSATIPDTKTNDDGIASDQDTALEEEFSDLLNRAGGRFGVRGNKESAENSLSSALAAVALAVPPPVKRLELPTPRPADSTKADADSEVQASGSSKPEKTSPEMGNGAVARRSDRETGPKQKDVRADKDQKNSDSQAAVSRSDDIKSTDPASTTQSNQQGSTTEANAKSASTEHQKQDASGEQGASTEQQEFSVATDDVEVVTVEQSTATPGGDTELADSTAQAVKVADSAAGKDTKIESKPVEASKIAPVEEAATAGTTAPVSDETTTQKADTDSVEGSDTAEVAAQNQANGQTAQSTTTNSDAKAAQVVAAAAAGAATAQALGSDISAEVSADVLKRSEGNIQLSLLRQAFESSRNGAGELPNSHANSRAIQGPQAASNVATPFQTKSSKNEQAQPNTSKPLSRPLASRTLERVESALREAAKSKDGKTLSFRLDPPQLGHVKVDVTLREGGLHARLTPENPQVTQMLRERSHDLQSSLRRLGLNVETVSVSVGSDWSASAAEAGFVGQGDVAADGKSFQDGRNNLPGERRQVAENTLGNELADISIGEDVRTLAKTGRSGARGINDHWVA